MMLRYVLRRDTRGLEVRGETDLPTPFALLEYLYELITGRRFTTDQLASVTDTPTVAMFVEADGLEINVFPVPSTTVSST